MTTNRARPIRKLISFSEQEWESVERRMQISGARSFGDFGRRTLLENEIRVRKVTFDPNSVGAELNKIGSNINQIARNVNAEQTTTLEEMRATRALVREVQQVIEEAIARSERDE